MSNVCGRYSTWVIKTARLKGMIHQLGTELFLFTLLPQVRGTSRMPDTVVSSQMLSCSILMNAHGESEAQRGGLYA